MVISKVRRIKFECPKCHDFSYEVRIKPDGDYNTDITCPNCKSSFLMSFILGPLQEYNVAVEKLNSNLKKYNYEVIPQPGENYILEATINK